MDHCLTELPWLPPAPERVREMCRGLSPTDPEVGASIGFLAGHRLRSADAAALGRAVARCLDARGLAPLSPFRLAVLSNATIDLIAETLPAAAARHGIALDVVKTPFDQVMQQALDPQSPLRRKRADAALIAVDHRWFGFDRVDLRRGADARIADAVGRLGGVVEALLADGNIPAIFTTIAVPPLPLFGNFERRVRETPRRLIEETNFRIAELAAKTGSYLFDVAAFAERVGTDRWFDPVQWNHYKLPFSAGCNDVYAEMLGRLLGAIRGNTKKCLVLDLDNTIWGGVVGDDGIDNIVLGQGSAAGEAFLAVQQLVLDLRERGIVLAVSSRNDDEVARQPFRTHTEMLLREEHIAVFQANWLDKASNLEAIAKTLNIGVDALVLLDDNPAERAYVRAALPTVGVPELPSDPSWYPWYLAAAGYFETVSFSVEDRLRAESYAADAKRSEVMARTRDLGEYLRSLDMAITFSPFDAPGRQRITQLINKTNQFNLTTRRYTEAEVVALSDDPSVFTLQVRLRDRFGDLGMIAVAICRAGSEGPLKVWEIETWLMSCRVLGRHVEAAMLGELAAAAQRAGAHSLIGLYQPSAKNGMVRDHYVKLGFELADETAAGERRFRLALADYAAPVLPLTVEWPGREPSTAPARPVAVNAVFAG